MKSGEGLRVEAPKEPRVGLGRRNASGGAMGRLYTLAGRYGHAFDLRTHAWTLGSRVVPWFKTSCKGSQTRSVRSALARKSSFSYVPRAHAAQTQVHGCIKLPKSSHNRPIFEAKPRPGLRPHHRPTTTSSSARNHGPFQPKGQRSASNPSQKHASGRAGLAREDVAAPHPLVRNVRQRKLSRHTEPRPGPD